jgi:protein-glutamine gamma-glutamyltransferase
MTLGLSGARAKPEDSIAIRVVCALAVEIGLVAVIGQGVLDGAIAALALAFAPVGYVLSYRRRSGRNIAIKVVLAAALLLATGRFLHAVGTIATPDEARAPLAELFVWVQVLHAFDVPRRRDLAFSMVSSTTLIAVGGALALNTGYLLALLAWAGTAGVWLWLSARPLAGDLSLSVIERGRRSGRRSSAVRSLASTVRSLATVVTVALVVAIAIFAMLPRVPVTMVRSLPFKMSPASRSADIERVSNPALPPPSGPGDVVDFTPDGYPGFSDVMDLRSRGTLSNDVVFRVRAPFASLWRAEVFDTFDGSLWTRSTQKLTPLPSSEGGYRVPGAEAPVTGAHATSPAGRPLVQTFFMEHTQPNVLFTAAWPQTVYFPSGGLRADPDLSIRAPIYLDEGLVYSVESAVPTTTPEQLSRLGPIGSLAHDRYLGRFLQLPDELPERDRRLAEQLTAGATSEYDSVMAVESWLRTNTRYDLTVPREPPGVDAVDHFLFDTHRGSCEHIASAMAVLLRAEGIPTRIVTGYGPGERNPFTGYYEVRYADAHAWVEVFYPGVGWMQYDPTFGVPPVPGAWGDAIGADLASWVAAEADRLVPDGVRLATGSLVQRAIGIGAQLGRAWPFVIFVGLAPMVWLFRRRRGRRQAPPVDTIAAAHEQLVAALADAGHGADPARTPAEVMHAVEADPQLAGEIEARAAFVLDVVARARFAPPPVRPTEDDARRALAAATRVRELTRQR